MDKISGDAIQVIGGSGIFGTILYWINVKWRFATIKDDLIEIKKTIKLTRSTETCNIMNHNIVERLKGIENIQEHIQDDIHKILLKNYV